MKTVWVWKARPVAGLLSLRSSSLSIAYHRLLTSMGVQRFESQLRSRRRTACRNQGRKAVYPSHSTTTIRLRRWWVQTLKIPTGSQPCRYLRGKPERQKMCKMQAGISPSGEAKTWQDLRRKKRVYLIIWGLNRDVSAERFQQSTLPPKKVCDRPLGHTVPGT